MAEISGLRKFVLALATVSTLVPMQGCSRAFWRQQADEDTYEAITEHITDPRWAVPRIDVTPDDRSRFFDPYDPDSAPLPPDDAAANEYMHWVDCWEGFKGWHEFGESMSVENPQWLANFGMTEATVDEETGVVTPAVPLIEELTLQQAAELQLIHNRAYQTQLENVYLAALDVAFERFRFRVRYLGASGSEPGGGIETRVVPGSTPDSAVMNARAGISQLLPAGTQWALELTNNTLWLFSGGGGTDSASVLSYSIIQPLLVNAGRKVGLENLTQTERNLLYAIRDLSRFRKENFSSLVASGTGYLGLLEQIQSIRNEEGNILRLQEQVERLLSDAQQNSKSAGADLAAMPPGVVIPPELQGKLEYRENLQRLLWRDTITEAEVKTLLGLSNDPAYQLAVNSIVQSLRTEVATLDVLQLQSDLQDSTNRLRVLRTSLETRLDSFKINLGLPPDIQLTISDELLKPFAVIDPRLTSLEEDANEFVKVWEGFDVDNPDRMVLLEAVDRLQFLFNNVERNGIEQVIADEKKFDAIIPARLESNQSDIAREQLRSDADRAKFLFDKAQIDYKSIKQAVSGLEGMLQRIRSDDTKSLQEVYTNINLLREDLLRLIQNLQVVQVSLRVELIELEPFEETMELSVDIGIENRLDLMNARAAVMDARRQVEVIANQLRGNLDVVVEGDFRNSGGNRPFDFRADRSELRAGIQFTAPLDQINERNAYRAALISYQRARREYMATEDNVKAQIRSNYRELIGAKNSLEIARRAVRLAALQYDSAVNESRKPKGPNEAQGSSGLAGRNLTQALNSILRAQNQLIGFWADYERNRINIHRDMGIMEVGADGVWEDSLYRKQADDNEKDATNETGPQLVPPKIDGIDGIDAIDDQASNAVWKFNGLDPADTGAASGRVRLDGGGGGRPELDYGIQLLNGSELESGDRNSQPRPFPNSTHGERASR